MIFANDIVAWDLQTLACKAFTNSIPSGKKERVWLLGVGGGGGQTEDEEEMINQITPVRP